jgi:hypothetical protein
MQNAVVASAAAYYSSEDLCAEYLNKNVAIHSLNSFCQSKVLHTILNRVRKMNQEFFFHIFEKKIIKIKKATKKYTHR